MTFCEVMNYIEEVKKKEGNKQTLSNVGYLCEKLGYPQRELTFILITGSNGKSSALTFISEILKASGYRTGGYITPAVFEQREKIRINGRPISQKEFCRQMTRLKELCQELMQEKKPHPTVRELEMAMAFQYFKEQGCQVVLWETDPGEWDAIASMLPDVFIHVFTFTGSEYRKRMENLKTSLTVSDLSKVSGVRRNLERQIFSYQEYKNLTLSLLGIWQTENGALAIEVIKQLRKKGFSIPEKAVYQGLSKAALPGRFQVLAKSPYFIVDGAKDMESIRRLLETIRFYFTGRKVIFIVGMLRDMEQTFDRQQFSLAEQILAIPTKAEGGLSSYESACILRNYHECVTAADSIEEAVELAYLLADKDTVILAFGSLCDMGPLIRFAEKVREKKGGNITLKDLHGKKRY